MDISKLTAEDKRFLGKLIAINELSSKLLEALKEDIRNLEDETNLETNYYKIDRSRDTRSKIVNAEYDKKLAELKAEYDEYKITTTKENYKITYKATKLSKDEATTIMQNILGLTQKDLQESIKAVCK